MDCPAEFKFKTEFRRHIIAVHSNTEEENDTASFLDAVKNSLEKVLPKAIEPVLGSLAQNQPNQMNGNSNFPMRWGRIPASSN
jgi:hypothetical protein